MNILQINKFYYLRGGSERYLFELSGELEKRGHRVIPFSMHDEKNLASRYSSYFIDPMDMHKFNFKNILKFFYNYDTVRKLKKLLREQKVDVAHLHNIAHQLTPAIIKVLKKNKIPIIQTLHDYKLICPNSQLYAQNKVCLSCNGQKYYHCFTKKCMHNSRAKSLLGTLEAYLNNKILNYYEQVDLFIAPSQFMKDICVSFGVPKEKIYVINNFIDRTKKENNKITEDYFLYFGRLNEEKGIDTIFESMKKINFNCKLKIVGDGPYFQELKIISKNLRIENQIEFLGYKHKEELNDIIDKAMAVILPSKWPENMPYSLLESLDKEKAVIVSNIGGMPEIIHDNKNGLLFEAGNSDDLAKKMDKIFTQVFKIDLKTNDNILINLNSKIHISEIEKCYLELKK
jgi:glycosyltransferase involved in cell wall biosynthesis